MVLVLAFTFPTCAEFDGCGPGRGGGLQGRTFLAPELSGSALKEADRALLARLGVTRVPLTGGAGLCVDGYKGL